MQQARGVDELLLGLVAVRLARERPQTRAQQLDERSRQLAPLQVGVLTVVAQGQPLVTLRMLVALFFLYIWLP